MSDISRRPGDDIFAFVMVVSATTGIIDAACVIGLGKVFAANIAGNILFLALAAAGTPGYSWALSITALGSFVAGAGVGGLIASRRAPAGRRGWLIIVAVADSGLMLSAAALSLWDLGGSSTITAVVALAGAAMGLRFATARHLKLPEMTTATMTLTLAGIAADTHAVSHSTPNLGWRLTSIIAFLIGAGIGAVLALHAGVAASFATAAIISFAATLILAKDAAVKSPARP